VVEPVTLPGLDGTGRLFRPLVGTRFERFELERSDGPHFLLQAKPRECAQRISEFSARIGV